MEVHAFKTIAAPGQGIYKDKGSKFFSFAFPVRDEAVIRDQLDQLRKQYFDARHHCFAWILGADGSRQRAFDDGEPNHSAGDPILGQIRSRSLTNVLVVVVRYFGGTKLGVGGLIQAYKTAASEALDQSGIMVQEVFQNIELGYDYADTPEVMRLIKDFRLTIVRETFDIRGKMMVNAPSRELSALVERLDLLHQLGKSIEYGLVD